MFATSPRHTRMTALFTGALASLALTASAMPTTAFAGASSTSSTRDARVVEVIDGDTLALSSPRGVRRYDLLGVRAPALGKCFGRQAGARLRMLLPAGTRVRVISRKRGARRIVVLRKGVAVNRLVVASGHALSTLEDGTRLARILAIAQQDAESDLLGLWDACASANADADEPQPGAAKPPVAKPPAQPPAVKPPTPAPAAPQATRLSRAEFQAFVEHSVFTRASSSSNFGGSSNRNDFTFCAGGVYRFESQTFGNGLATSLAEVGSWRLVELTRSNDLQADEGRLELVTKQSNASDFDPASPESTRTFSVAITVLDDGRTRVNSQPAERSTAGC